jgi:hypothetical protein
LPSQFSPQIKTREVKRPWQGHVIAYPSRCVGMDASTIQSQRQSRVACLHAAGDTASPTFNTFRTCNTP